MIVPFIKYQGAGNDFILVDNRSLGWNPDQDQVMRMCDRHFGIGADGLMLLMDNPGFDFHMIYFNSDGRESTMCGNGGRCMTLFAHRLGMTGPVANFSAVDGPHVSEILVPEPGAQIRLKMKEVRVEEILPDHVFLDTGSPHFVVFTKDVGKMEIVPEARKIRYGGRFRESGTNVDFVEVFPDHLYVRSYERGVENETLSCGTGVTAAVLAHAMTGNLSTRVMEVRTRGGILRVSYLKKNNLFRDIWLEGPAEFVFQGEFMI